MPFISDPNLNKYAIDTTQYASVTAQLVGFMRGKRISVTYYRSLLREPSNNRTNIADLATTRNVIDSEYQKILNLEITLPKGFEFLANNSQANATIKGQAMFYPKMNPNIGDIFLTGVGDGRTGVCRISLVTPMSWRNDRIYVVDFVVQQFLDTTTFEALDASVTQTSVFSKENYLGGTAALLSEQTYLQLLKIKELRANFCRLYHQTFFDSSLCSYIRPDGLYDPWVVNFMANKLSMDDVQIWPKNLLGKRPETYRQTLWARLEDRFNTTLYGLSPYTNILGYGEDRMGTFVTELYGRSILFPAVEDNGDSPYLYSINFYNGVTASMTAEELLIYEAITKRNCGDLSILLINYLDLVYTLSPDDQFYKIPIYIHLIDMALQSQYREIDAPSMSYALGTDETGG